MIQVEKSLPITVPLNLFSYSKAFFNKALGFLQPRKKAFYLKCHWEIRLILHILCIYHIKICMLYLKLCIFKINEFCVKDLLYEHEFPLKVWPWVLLEKYLSQSGQVISSIWPFTYVAYDLYLNVAYDLLFRTGNFKTF